MLKPKRLMKKVMLWNWIVEGRKESADTSTRAFASIQISADLTILLVSAKTICGTKSVKERNVVTDILKDVNGIKVMEVVE